MSNNIVLSIKERLFYINSQVSNLNSDLEGFLININIDPSYTENLHTILNSINSDQENNNYSNFSFTIPLQTEKCRIFLSNGEVNIECLNIINNIINDINNIRAMYANYNSVIILELFNMNNYMTIEEVYIPIAITNIINWLNQANYKNIVMEIIKDSNYKYTYNSLKPTVIHKYIAFAQKLSSNSYYIGCSFSGEILNNDLYKNINRADIMLLHNITSIKSIYKTLDKINKPIIIDYTILKEFCDTYIYDTEKYNISNDKLVTVNVLKLDNVSDKIYSNLLISNKNDIGIMLNNCKKLVFNNCHIINCAGEGFSIINSEDIEIKNCILECLRTGIYVKKSKNIYIHNNYCKNVLGPKPRGQFVQFDSVTGTNNIIKDNIVINEQGKSNPEDIINLYKSNGIKNKMITVKNNYINGGGPSKTGGGIMLGDNGGSNQQAIKNILINPGQYGIACSGGNNIKIEENKIFAKPTAFTNVGIYTWNQSPLNSDNIIIKNNDVGFFNKSGSNNSWWDGQNINNITLSGNKWNLNYQEPQIQNNIGPSNINFEKNIQEKDKYKN